MIVAEVITTSVSRGIAECVIQRAEKANALTAAGKFQLAAELHDLSGRDDVHAIIITGAGTRNFCGGSDVAELVDLDVEPMIAMLEAEHAMYAAALGSDKPIVAVVNGHAMGTGLLLVISCDYAVAVRHATFGVPELAVGASTPLEGVLLPWIIGLGWSRAMYFGGRRLDSNEAIQLGIIHEVADDGVALDRARAVADDIASAPTAFCSQKRWMRRLINSGNLEAVIQESIYSGALQLVGPDVKDGARRFLEQRRTR